MKLVFDKFSAELKKDILFFGGCGFTVALFLVWQARFQELGITKNAHWANELFSDFISLNAFSLVFLGYLLLACIANISIGLGCSFPKLTNAVSHMESRLTQIASSIIAFMVGLLTFVVLYSILNFDDGGLKLIFLAFVFSFLILGSLTAALLIGHRTKPYNIWWVSVLTFAVFACLLAWLLVQGGK